MNPTKVVFVYCLAFMLVCFHQAGRVADWFNDLAIRHDEGLIAETAFSLSEFFRVGLNPYGPAQLNWLEDKALSLFSPNQRPALLADNIWEAGLKTVPGGLAGPGDEALPPESGGRELTLKNHLEDNGRADEPYAELPPIYLTLAPPRSPSGLDHKNKEALTASLSPLQNKPADLAEKEPEIAKPSTVLLLGDSMMLEGLGPPLQRALKRNEGLKVYRDGRYGTGLTRLDNFDWLAYFDEILDKYEPDLVILTVGANDAQDMVGSGRRVHLGSENWNKTYVERVGDLLSRAEARGVTVFWVGLPIMGQEPYGQRIAAINNLASEACGLAANCRFWDSWLSVADAKGNYAVFLSGADGKSIRVRAKDNIHLTESGGRIMAEKFLADIAFWADFNAAGQEAGGSVDAQPEFRPFNGGQAQAPSAGEGQADDEAAKGGYAAHVLWSPIRNKETAYYLARPDIVPGRKYPLLMLLHGAWAGGDTWEKNVGRSKLAELARNLGLILLMPDGEPFGWYVDGREAKIESYLIDELLPHVLAAHPEADASRIGISGISMGGHGALTLTMKHPGLFKAAGAISAVTDLSLHAGSRHPVDQQLMIAEALGPAGPEGRNWAPFSAQGLTEAEAAFWRGRPLVLSVGLNDSLTLDENRAYHQLLKAQKHEHLYRENAGGHDWVYWRAELPAHLEFMSRQLKGR